MFGVAVAAQSMVFVAAVVTGEVYVEKMNGIENTAKQSGAHARHESKHVQTPV